jgi:hypothetical protein
MMSVNVAVPMPETLTVKSPAVFVKKPRCP